jgi:hypothetical protein
MLSVFPVPDKVICATDIEQWRDTVALVILPLNTPRLKHGAITVACQFEAKVSNQLKNKPAEHFFILFAR